jgi:EAL domain-containing protein (putative c-di-GMP-specific phosphodiesterase class I)
VRHELTVLDMDSHRTTARISVAYQPIVDRAGNIVMYEALARPADDTDLDALITGYSLQLAAGVLRLVEQSDMKKRHRVLVNIEPATLNSDGVMLIELFQDAIETGAIGVEVTERGVLTSPAVHALQRLAALGVEVWLDDFGTFNSNPAERCELFEAGIITGVKIDKANPPGVIEEVLSRWNVPVLQEGVETASAAEAALAAGVSFMQGHLFGSPLQDPTSTTLCLL